MKKSQQDLIWWLNSFGWLYEPRPDLDGRRKANATVTPFFTWPHQEPVIRGIAESLGRCDRGIEKSRAEGASWIVLLVFLHDWLFVPMSKFSLVSRTEDMVDNADDPDSLMWKLNFAYDNLPDWMKPKRFRRNTTDHSFINEDNGSRILGYSATGDVARGGRAKAFLMDEIASFGDDEAGKDTRAMNSTQSITNCRIMVSTYRGPFGEFYTAMRGGRKTSIVKYRLAWWENPTKNIGLYSVAGGL